MLAADVDGSVAEASNNFDTRCLVSFNCFRPISGKLKTVIGKATNSLAEDDDDWEENLPNGSLDVDTLGEERIHTECSDDSSDTG